MRSKKIMNSNKEILIAISEIEKLRTKSFQFSSLNNEESNYKFTELINKAKTIS